MRGHMRRLAITLGAIAALAGCATNPVTGRSELALVSEAQELEIGREQYGPARQMQGGDYNVDPALTQYVDSVGQRLAAVSDRELPYEFTVINDGTPNAWALPGGKIAVNRGLLSELENEAELAAVLGHEIVHAAARHGAQSLQRQQIMQGAILVAGVAAAASDTAPPGLVMGASSLAASLLNQKYGRGAELESDRYGMEYMAKAGYDPQAAVTLQEKFVKLAEGRQTGWLEGLFASHPPSEERVAANREQAKTLPTGELGTERYVAATEQLRTDAPAYAALERGRKALKEKDTAAALAAAEEAIRIQPREAQFHALRGDVRFVQENYEDAITNYDRAAQYDDDFFYYPLQRGLAEQALGRNDAALADLQSSVELLPTTTAVKALADIHLERGDREQAVKLYRQVAGSESPAGRDAAATLVRLELAERPGEYLPARVGAGARGEVLVEVRNPTPVAVDNVEVTIQFSDAAGQVRTLRRRLGGVLPAGETAIVSTGLGPVSDPAELQRVRAAVTAARVASQDDIRRR